MTRQEFIKIATSRGYAYYNQILRWLKRYKKDDYTEDDLIEIYRFAEALISNDSSYWNDVNNHYEEKYLKSDKEWETKWGEWEERKNLKRK